MNERKSDVFWTIVGAILTSVAILVAVVIVGAIILRFLVPILFFLVASLGGAFAGIVTYSINAGPMCFVVGVLAFLILLALMVVPVAHKI